MTRCFIFVSLFLLAITGCGQTCPSVLVSNQSVWPVRISGLSIVEAVEESLILPGEMVSILSTHTTLDRKITITWYTDGGPDNDLPAIRKTLVGIPDKRGAGEPLVLTFDPQKKWTAALSQ